MSSGGSTHHHADFNQVHRKVHLVFYCPQTETYHYECRTVAGFLDFVSVLLRVAMVHLPDLQAPDSPTGSRQSFPIVDINAEPCTLWATMAQETKECPLGQGVGVAKAKCSPLPRIDGGPRSGLERNHIPASLDGRMARVGRVRTNHKAYRRLRGGCLLYEISDQRWRPGSVTVPTASRPRFPKVSKSNFPNNQRSLRTESFTERGQQPSEECDSVAGICGEVNGFDSANQ